MFCDLGGYTQWTSEEEPEEVAAILDRLKQRAVDIVEAHGGLVNQFVGDEVVGLFGVLRTHEDDPCRAVAAALALHAFVRELRSYRANGEPLNLRMHTGIESGVLYARLRDIRAGVYEVTGDAMNTAARLRSLATQDEIIVGPEAQRRVAPFFKLERHAVSEVRGKHKPMLLYRVLGPTENRSFFEVARARGLTRYVGREEELRWLCQAWEQAVSGRGRLASVGGPPGIGKSRLFHEFRQRIAREGQRSSSLLLHGRCEAYGDLAPYQPFSTALSEWLGEDACHEARVRERCLALGPELEASLPLLLHVLACAQGPASPELDLSGEPLRDAIVEALAQWMLVAARQRPVLLLLEDWHWADAASRDALRVIAPRLTGARVLIAVNYRSAELKQGALPEGQLELTLLPLTAAENEDIARSVLRAQDLPRQLRAFIHERAQGNPFFVEEVCRALQQQGVMADEQGQITLVAPLQGLDTPATIQALVRMRIDRLHPRQRQALRLASIIGEEFSLASLRTLIDGEYRRRMESESRSLSSPPPEPNADLEGWCGELQALGLLYHDAAQPAGSAYQFKHAITRQVAYETIPLDQRRFHHGLLAEELERSLDAASRETQLEVLAFHYALSARQDKALEYTLLSAAKAWRAFSPRQAERHYQRVVELLDRTRELSDAQKRLRIDTSLEWVRVGLYNPAQEHVDALQRSIVLSNDIGYARGACLSLNWLGWVEETRGNIDNAVKATLGFLDGATELGDAALVAQALTLLGNVHYFEGEPQRALSAFERGLSMRIRHDGAAYRYAQGQLAMILADRGEFARARALMEQALSSVTEMGMITMQAPLLVQRAFIEAWQGQFAASAETARSANAIATRIEAQYIFGVSLFQYGYGRFMSSGEARALHNMRQAVEHLDRAGMRLMLSLCLALLGESLLRLDEVEPALACATRALARCEVGDRLGEIAAHRVAALAHSRLGEHDLAEQNLQKAIALAQARGAARDLAITEYCAASIGTRDPERAARFRTSALSRLAALGLTFEQVGLAGLRDGVQADSEL